MLWPPIRYSYNTHNLALPLPAPSPPTWLLTDAQCAQGKTFAGEPAKNCSRDRMELARHRRPGPRRGGAADLRLPHFRAVRPAARRHFLGRRHRRGRGPGLFRRLDRSAVPALHRNLVVAAEPLSADHPLGDHHAELLRAARASCCPFPGSIWSHVVRAEFLRARNFDYVRAARALGLSNRKIMVKHVLPNAMVATMTFLPFILNSLDHHLDLAGLSRLRPAARLALAGRIAAAGQDPICRRPGSACPASSSSPRPCRCWSSSARRCATPSIRERRF